MNFWNHKLPKVDNDTDNKFEAVCKRLDDSYQSLMQSTLELADQASKTTEALKNRLELAERKFSTLVNCMDDVVLVKSVDRKWVSANRFACDLFHFDSKSCIGKTNDELKTYYPKLSKIFDEFDDAERLAIETRNTQTIRLIVEENRQSIYIDTLIIPIQTKDGKLREIIIVGHNNTHFYQSMKRISAGDDMLNALSNPVLIVDNCKRIYFVNRAFQNEYGYDYDSVINKDFDEIIPSEYVSDLRNIFETHITKSVDIRNKNVNLKVTPIINEHIYSPIYYLLTFYKTKNG